MAGYQAFFEDDEGPGWLFFDDIAAAEEWIKKQAYYVDLQEAEPPADHPDREHIIKYWAGEFWAAEPATLYDENDEPLEEEIEPVRYQAWIRLS